MNSAFGVDHGFISKDLWGSRKGTIKQSTKGKSVTTVSDVDYKPGKITQALGVRDTNTQLKTVTQARNEKELPKVERAGRNMARMSNGAVFASDKKRSAWYGPRTKISEV